MTARLALLSLCAGLLVACTTPPPASQTPAGFADYEGTQKLQAVNAERVVYQVRQIDNKPRADLAFWRVAMKEHLLKSGYVLVTEGELGDAARPGYFIETSAPRGRADYMYLVAIFVQDQHITVIEAAGELAAYKARREQIFAALKSSGAAPADRTR
jgi:hypothetical protein